MENSAVRIMLAVLWIAGSTAAIAGTHLAAGEITPAPPFDAGDGVPGREGWALGPGRPATFRSIPEIVPTRRVAPPAVASKLLEPRKPFDLHYTLDGQSHSVAELRHAPTPPDSSS